MFIMKKKTIANLIMVLTIALIVAVGALIAWCLRPVEESVYGAQFHREEIPENRLVTSEDAQNLCTITIRCDTIFDNADALEKAKAPYVPEDGVILPVTTVEFTSGETVFDVLQRVCEAADIQLEYSWTPLYDSYYVEGINHLYEFDCGFESGWMYKVNGWFPNYGCSAYELQGGEEIVWCYTCTGLGTDVGAERME
jgi:hypothetical protein